MAIFLFFCNFCLILRRFWGLLTLPKLWLILSSQQHQSHCGQERIITIDEESCLCKIEERILKKLTALLYRYCLYTASVSLFYIERGADVLFYISGLTHRPSNQKGGYIMSKVEHLQWLIRIWIPTNKPFHNRKFMDDSKHF